MTKQTMLAALANRRNEALTVAAARYADPEEFMVDMMDGRPLGMRMNGRKEEEVDAGEDNDPMATSGVLVNVCQLETGLIAAQSKSACGSSAATKKEKEMKRMMEVKAKSAAASKRVLFHEDHVVTVVYPRIMSNQGESPTAEERSTEEDANENGHGKTESLLRSPRQSYADVAAGCSMLVLPTARRDATGVGIAVAGSGGVKDVVKDVVGGGSGHASLIEVNIVDKGMDAADAAGGVRGVACEEGGEGHTDIDVVDKGIAESDRRERELQDRINRLVKAKIAEIRNGDRVYGFLKTQGEKEKRRSGAEEGPALIPPIPADETEAEREDRWRAMDARHWKAFRQRNLPLMLV
ncbi:hypothetical protein HK102_006468 [Quaeritorhiza haematococci]|nr:hypothetical protein HK102_006468 [Quaeritorhiza haematococci]